MTPDLTEPARSAVERAIAAFERGEPVVVTDDHDRENEGDLFIPATAIDTAGMAFLLRHTSGIVCVSMPDERLERLGLHPMVPRDANAESMRTAFTVSADARDGVTTGVSAADRTATAKVLADPAAEPGDLVRPGHMFPLRAHPQGVLGRRGHTEAAHDLAVLAGLPPVVVLSELMHPDGTMMRASAIGDFSRRHGLAQISVDDLVRYRSVQPRVIERGYATVPRDGGVVTVRAFESLATGVEHAALVVGNPGDTPALVRVHSECFTGDLLGSHRCDCGEQLRQSLRMMRAEGAGVVIYLRGHEGRGIGLGAKLRAYRLQDGGLDTVDANAALGLPVDARRYDEAAEILHALGMSSIRLLTNNPDKVRQLCENGIKVTESISLPATVTPDNRRYLAAKQDRLGHRPDALAAALADDE